VTFGGQVDFNDFVNMMHTVTIGGDLFANADVTIQGLNVNTESNLSGNLIVTGKSLLQSSLTVRTDGKNDF
jgi:hypothetical protein